MIKVDFKPKTNVEQYLTNDFNTRLYYQLTEDEKYKSMFDVLIFFNLLYEQFEIVRTNIEKPISVTNHLLQLGLQKEQLHYLLYNLNRLLSEITNDKSDSEVYRPFKICKGFIAKEFNKLDEELNPKKVIQDVKQEKKYDFEQVKEHLETLPDIKSKLKYLLEIKTEVKQKQHVWDVWLSTSHNNFIPNIDLEIAKIKDLLMLENQPEQPKGIILPGELTNSQLVLIFFYFFKQNGLEPRRNLDISPIAKFLHLITGKEFNAIKNSDFYKKLQSVPNFKSDQALIRDLETIKPLFERVQLTEIVKMIDNEIDMARNEISRIKRK